MKPMSFLPLAFALAASLLHAAPDKDTFKAELAEAEHSFCALATSQGVTPAFLHFASPEAAFINTEPTKLHGAEAVTRHLAGIPKDLQLTWSPSYIDVSDDGTLGYTYGRYEARFTDSKGERQANGGYYLTIWKRQADGTWKYVMDTGAPDPQPKPAAATPDHH